jgi:c-di-GMP-related signal transduction protein
MSLQQQVRTDSRIRGCRESRRLAARFLFASEARATTQAWPARLLAEKVETASALRDCVDLGFDLFQGFFCGKPQVLAA